MKILSKLVRGSLLLTAATFLSKFLGLIYLIPFNALVGTEGGALYNIAYVPYNIMLSIATVGIPLAMSKRFLNIMHLVIMRQVDVLLNMVLYLCLSLALFPS